MVLRVRHRLFDLGFVVLRVRFGLRVTVLGLRLWLDLDLGLRF